MLRCLTKRLHYLLDLGCRGHVDILVPYLHYHSTYDRAVSLTREVGGEGCTCECEGEGRREGGGGGKKGGRGREREKGDRGSNKQKKGRGHETTVNKDISKYMHTLASSPGSLQHTMMMCDLDRSAKRGKKAVHWGSNTCHLCWYSFTLIVPSMQC